MRKTTRDNIILGSLPFLALLGAWFVLPLVQDIPSYKLPPLQSVVSRAIELTLDGSLWGHVTASLQRLLVGFLIGNLLAIPVGMAIGLNRHLSDFLRPTLTFFQSIAGIAWIPLAVLWMGLGDGAIIFVIANVIFFMNVFNTVVGVESIPNVLYRSVRSHGGRGLQVLTELIIPGALVQLILGLRSSVAYGWRALVGAELIAGTSGLGYLTIDAVEWYQTDTVILGMIVIGILWLIIDRALFVPFERLTVIRWGMQR